jgi:hypothetical protein
MYYPTSLYYPAAATRIHQHSQYQMAMQQHHHHLQQQQTTQQQQQLQNQQKQQQWMLQTQTGWWGGWSKQQLPSTGQQAGNGMANGFSMATVPQQQQQQFMPLTGMQTTIVGTDLSSSSSASVPPIPILPYSSAPALPQQPLGQGMLPPVTPAFSPPLADTLQPVPSYAGHGSAIQNIPGDFACAVTGNDATLPTPATSAPIPIPSGLALTASTL